MSLNNQKRVARIILSIAGFVLWWGMSAALIALPGMDVYQLVSYSFAFAAVSFIVALGAWWAMETLDKKPEASNG